MNEIRQASLLGKILCRIIKERNKLNPEDIARNAFLLVNSVGPHNQVSTTTFLDELDFTKLKSGSILRVHFKQQTSGESQWDWLAFGGMGANNEIFLYAARSKKDFWLADCNNLQLPPEWKMKRLRVNNKPLVHVENVWEDIYQEAVLGSRDETYFPQKIDIITGGKPVGVRRNIPIRNFNPIPARVSNTR